MKIAHLYGKIIVFLQHFNDITPSFILVSVKQHYRNETISKPLENIFNIFSHSTKK